MAGFKRPIDGSIFVFRQFVQDFPERLRKSTNERSQLLVLMFLSLTGVISCLKLFFVIIG